MRKAFLSFLPIGLLAACTPKEGAKTAGGAAGGTFIYAAPGDATDIFPPFVADQNGAVVIDLVFDHLADISRSLETAGDKSFTPRLAKSWTWSPDSLSITFALDPKARWHDGAPVTAADVRYSVRAFIDPKAASPAAPLLENVDSASVRDSLTAVIWFKKHTPEQFYDVAYQLYIMPEHVYGAIPLDSLRTSDLTRKPIGSGQYRFVKWEPDVRLELIADTANYHGRPPIDRFIITPVNDPAAMRTQVLAGDADFMQNFPPDFLPQLDSSKVARPLVVPLLQYIFMGMNPYQRKSKMIAHPVFSDARVRRALSMALDRGAMLQNVFLGHGMIAHGPFPATLAAADTALKLPPYDTVAANALLDSAGWRRGPAGMRAKLGTPLRFSLMVPAPSVPRRKYAVLIQEALRHVGAQVDIDVVDTKVFLERIQFGGRAGDFDAMLHNFATDPSPNTIRQTWATDGIGPQGQNALRYSNQKVDALVDSMAISFDPAKVRQYASRAYQQIVDDAPAIWLYDLAGVDAVSRRVNVGPIRADGWWRSFTEWSIPPDKRIARDQIGLNR